MRGAEASGACGIRSRLPLGCPSKHTHTHLFAPLVFPLQPQRVGGGEAQIHRHFQVRISRLGSAGVVLVIFAPGKGCAGLGKQVTSVFLFFFCSKFGNGRFQTSEEKAKILGRLKA